MQRLIIIGAVLVMMTVHASAEGLYKCKAPDGRTVISNAPCAAGSKESVIPRAVLSPRATPPLQPTTEEHIPRQPIAQKTKAPGREDSQQVFAEDMTVLADAPYCWIADSNDSSCSAVLLNILNPECGPGRICGWHRLGALRLQLRDTSLTLNGHGLAVAWLQEKMLQQNSPQYGAGRFILKNISKVGKDRFGNDSFLIDDIINFADGSSLREYMRAEIASRERAEKEENERRVRAQKEENERRVHAENDLREVLKYLERAQKEENERSAACPECLLDMIQRCTEMCYGVYYQEVGFCTTNSYRYNWGFGYQQACADSAARKYDTCVRDCNSLR